MSIEEKNNKALTNDDEEKVSGGIIDYFGWRCKSCGHRWRTYGVTPKECEACHSTDIEEVWG